MDPSILDQVEQTPSRVRSDGILEHFCDGEVFRMHPLFSSDPLPCKLLLFMTNLNYAILFELKSRNKLGIYLFTLGNLHPKYCSSLRVIDLFIAVTVPIVEKYGLNDILQAFVRDLQNVGTDGITVKLHGTERNFCPVLLAFLGDNLASTGLAGLSSHFPLLFASFRHVM